MNFLRDDETQVLTIQEPSKEYITLFSIEKSLNCEICEFQKEPEQGNTYRKEVTIPMRHMSSIETPINHAQK